MLVKTRLHREQAIEPVQRRPRQPDIDPDLTLLRQSEPGSALPEGLRGEMEERIGHEFANVRVFTGSQASATASRLGARAFTVGQHIVFGGGHFRPHEPAGRRLVAHELTHVAQNRVAAPPETSVSDPASDAERQAQRVAESVTSDPAAASVDSTLPVTLAAPAAVVQRDPNSPTPPPAAPPATPPAPGAPNANPNADKEREEREKQAFENARARAGQPAATVTFNSQNQRAKDGPVTETFFIGEVVERPQSDPKHYGFETPGPAIAFAATIAPNGGAVFQQDGFFFASRLREGKRKLRVTDPGFLEGDWWLGRDYVYRVDPSGGINGITGMGGYTFPLNSELEPDPAKSRFQKDPKMATPASAADMKAVAGVLPDSAKPGEKPKMPDQVDIPEDQYESFIISYFRARGLETLEYNEKFAADLTEKFKPAPGGPDGKPGGGLQPDAKKLIDESRRGGVIYKDLMDKEAELEALVDFMEAKKKQGLGIVTDWDVTFMGQTKKRTAWIAQFRKDQDDIKTRINNALSASPLLAMMVERQDPKKRFQGNVAPDFDPSVPKINKNNPYDRSILAGPATPENDEKIRKDMLEKLDAARKAIRSARSDVVEGDADFLLGLSTLKQRVEIDLSKVTGKNKGLAEKLKLMTANKAATDKVYETGALVIQAGLLFVPGGQFLSAAAGFVTSAANTDARLKVWNASKATVDPSAGLANQQQAESEVLSATFRIAVDAVMLAAGVNSALEALETGKVPKDWPTDPSGKPTTPQVDFGKKTSSGGETGSLAEKPGAGVFEGTWPGQDKPVVFKIYPDEPWAHTILRDEIANARAAAATGRGPRVFGEVRSPGKIGFAMEKVEGNFAYVRDQSFIDDIKDPVLRAKALAEIESAGRAVNAQTAIDVQSFGDRMWIDGRYCTGDLQGFVDAQGRWKAIDLQGFARVPELGSPMEEAFKSHTKFVNREVEKYTAIARTNAANAMPNPPAP